MELKEGGAANDDLHSLLLILDFNINDELTLSNKPLFCFQLVFLSIAYMLRVHKANPRQSYCPASIAQ